MSDQAETDAVLSDPELMNDVREGLVDIEAGRVVLAEGVDPARRDVVTEYALLMSGGSMQVHYPANPEVERIYPLALWIEHQTRLTHHVYRRRVIVVSDWEEVTEP